MRKTRQMRELETKHGRPIEDVLYDAIQKHGSVSAAAVALDLSRNTALNWTWRLGMSVDTVVTRPDQVAS
jgi:hypothetical protein